MNSRTRGVTTLLFVVALVLQACGSSAEPVETSTGDTPGSTADTTITTTTAVTTTTAASTTTEAGMPTPVAAWSLRGDGKDNVGDLDLEFVGGYTITADGVAFDGLDGQAVTTGPGPLDPSKSLTLSAWVAFTDQRVDVPMIVSLTNENELTMGIGLAGDAWIFGTTTADVFGSHPLVSNDWVYLVGVSDREAGVLRIYVDGKLIDEVEASEPTAASGPLIVGGEVVRGGWAGAIADVAVYQTALTTDQVAELHGTTKPTGLPPQWTPDPATYGDGILTGTWDQIQNEATTQRILNAFIAEFGPEQYAGVDEVAIRFGFDGPLYWQGYVFDGVLFLEPGGYPGGSSGTFTIEGDKLILHEREGDTGIRWELDGDTLGLPNPLAPFDSDNLTRSSDDPSY